MVQVSLPGITRLMPLPIDSMIGFSCEPNIKKLTKYTTNCPKMMANWFQLTSWPRLLAGDISPMYIGQMALASPTPTPPMIR